MSRLFPWRPPVETTATTDLQTLRFSDDRAEEVFSTLSSNTTRDVLSELYAGPKTASELSDSIDTSIQNTKYHLDKLLDADLVTITDTWYSESGNEMKVYAPSHRAIVLYETDDETKPVRDALSRLFGAVVLLAIGRLIIDAVTNDYLERRADRISADPVLEPSMLDYVLANIGDLFFALGLILVLVHFWREYSLFRE